MNPFRNDTAEFFAKAKELGLVDEIDQKLEARKHERRLAVIAKIKALPTEAETELPALGKGCTAAHKALELAEEARSAADRNYKDLSVRLYGAQLKFDGARLTLEREAQSLAPDFLRTAWEDLGYLDGLVSACFRFETEATYSYRHGQRTNVTCNGEQVNACRQKIKAAQDRIMAMTLEATAPDVARAEVATIFVAMEKEAYALGVDMKVFASRRKPVDVIQQAQDYEEREKTKIRQAAEQRRSKLQSLSV